MTTYCLDTDFLIEVLRGEPPAARLFREIVEEGVPRVSAVTAFELTDVAGARRRTSAMDLLAALEVVPLDGSVAVAASRISLDLRARGREMPMADLVIAATCLLRGMTLVTRNAKHFGRIRRLEIVAW